MTTTALPVNNGAATPTCVSSEDTLTPSGSCVLTEALEIFDATSNDWEMYNGIDPSKSDWPFVDFASFDNTFGVRGLSINTNDRDSYNEPTTFNFRWKISDALSTQSGGTIYQTFDVTINYICYNDVMVLNTAAATSN